MKRKRFLALLLDWGFISIYLVLLMSFTLIITAIFSFDLSMSSIQLQFLAFFTSVLPITCYFIYREIRYSSTWGKEKTGLVVKTKTKKAIIFRNILKFLPWQLGHMSTIRGIYHAYDALAIIYSTLSLLLVAIYVISFVLSKQGKTVLDYVTKTYVIKKDRSYE